MLEWVCPKCDRAVDPAFDVCPFCRTREAAAPRESPVPVRRARRGLSWNEVERGFRFGLGFVAVLALIYFLVFLVAYVQGNDALLARLLRWIHWR